MSRQEWENAHVARIPHEVVGRESREATQLRALIQGLADAVVNFTENDHEQTSDVLQDMLAGGGFRIGTGSEEDGVWISIEVKGDPFVGMNDFRPLNDGEPLSRSEYEERLPELLERAGVDPRGVGGPRPRATTPQEDLLARWGNLDPVDLDELDA